MSSISKKANGSYVIRVSTGKNYQGKYTTVSKVFWPSKPNLSYASLQRELNMFKENLELQVMNGDVTSKNSVPKSHGKTLFEDFCKIFIDIKRPEISPTTLAFYSKVIEQHLIPTYGKMHLDEFRISHVQSFIQYVAGKKREDFHGYGQSIAATTVKRYTTVFRSILSLKFFI